MILYIFVLTGCCLMRNTAKQTVRRGETLKLTFFAKQRGKIHRRDTVFNSNNQ